MDAERDSPNLSATEMGLFKKIAMKRYSKYLTSVKSSPAGDGAFDSLASLLNGVIRSKLKIIPENVT